jgi:hypothetical protein
MKARTTSTQPGSSEGDQAGHVADFIDSIDPEPTSANRHRVLIVDCAAVAPQTTLELLLRIATTLRERAFTGSLGRKAA